MEDVNLYTSGFLSSKRLQGDPEADAFIAHCFANTASKTLLYNWLKQLGQNTALNHIPAEYYNYQFMKASMLLPLWADARQMQHGSAFFLKYSESILRLLGLLSLPYCYAAADGAMVLAISQRLRNDAGKRLSDTANFIWDVMAPNAFGKDGAGFAAILKIRLTHAAARFYTLKSGKWNNVSGLPVNQEDMAGTNLAFSLIVIRGLRKLGYSISYAEQQSFLHIWNVMGFLLGIQEELIPRSGKSANALELAIRQRQFKQSEHGSELTSVLVDCFTSFPDIKASSKETLQLMRFLLGDTLADMLGIRVVPVPFYLPVILKMISNMPDLKPEQPANIEYVRKYRAFKKENARFSQPG